MNEDLRELDLQLADALAEIESLKAERDALKDTLHSVLVDALAEIERLKAERDARLKDTLQSVHGHYERVCKERAASKAQPEQEPVEYQYRTRPEWIPEWNRWNTCSKDSADAYEKNPYLHDWHYEVRTLYASPPQRQPLTDEAILKCFAESDGTFISSGRAIEAAHGIGDKT